MPAREASPIVARASPRRGGLRRADAVEDVQDELGRAGSANQIGPGRPYALYATCLSLHADLVTLAAFWLSRSISLPVKVSSTVLLIVFLSWIFVFHAGRRYQWLQD